MTLAEKHLVHIVISSAYFLLCKHNNKEAFEVHFDSESNAAMIGYLLKNDFSAVCTFIEKMLPFGFDDIVVDESENFIYVEEKLLPQVKVYLILH